MNSLVQFIHDFCRDHLLQEKRIIAPTRRIGFQWMAAAAREGGRCLNTRVCTLKSLALDIASQHSRFTLVSRNEGVFLLEQAWNAGRSKAGKNTGYLFSLEPNAELLRSLWNTIQDIRFASLAPSELNESAFEIPAKGREIALLLEEYTSLLKQNGSADYADVYRTASDALKNNPAVFPDQSFILVPETVHTCRLETEFLQMFPEGTVVRVPSDKPFEKGEEARTPETGLELLRYITHPESAPVLENVNDAEIFRAGGEVNEVREVFRRCLSRGIPLDEVEILYTDMGTYLPILYEECRSFTESDGFDYGLPATFADGIPVSYSRPGRALAEWITWIHEGFPQVRFARLIQDGLLKHDTDDIPSYELSSLFSDLRIGVGRDRYPRIILGETKAVRHRLKNADEEIEPELAKRLAGLKALDLLCLGVLGCVPLDNGDPHAVFESAARFVGEFCRKENRADEYAGNELKARLEELSSHVREYGLETALDPWEVLRSLVSELRIEGSVPRPGHMHIAGLSSGGHSARKWTFILGLDDGRFPGFGKQDPFILDNERSRLSRELHTNSMELSEREEHFYRLICGLRGNAVFSCSTYDILDDREKFPSPQLLTIYRILSGEHDGELEDFNSHAGSRVSFAPVRSEECISDTEWEILNIRAQYPVDMTVYYDKRYSHLNQGIRALERRSSTRFTEYDGSVPEAGPDIAPFSDTGMVFSSGRLETYGTCPLRFFYSYVLNIQPLDELEIDPDIWVTPMEYGTVLHDVFSLFLIEKKEHGDRVDFDSDLPLINSLLEKRVQQAAAEFPVPSREVYERTAALLQSAAAVFLRSEASRKGQTPVFLEANIGMPSRGKAETMGMKEPAVIELENDRCIRVRARVDRIDRIDDEENLYGILDYKTGSSFRYGKDDHLWEGRVLQHVVYLAAVEQMLRKKVSPDARVRDFRYYFPGRKEWGQELVRTKEELPEGFRVIHSLCNSIEQGVFPPTDAVKEDCTFCDFKEMCGVLTDLEEQSKAKYKEEENKELHLLREIQSG